VRILLLSPESRRKPVLDYLQARGHVVQVRTDRFTLGELERSRVDLVISHGYDYIIKEPVISAYRHRILNIHATYLPYGRGIYGNLWSFFEDTPKGVSLHFIDAGVDSGDVVARRLVPLSEAETLQSSWQVLMDAVEDLFFATWPAIEAGVVSPTGQADLGDSGSFHNRREGDRLLSLLPQRWNTGVAEVRELGREFARSRELFYSKHGVVLYDEDHAAHAARISGAQEVEA
jgi:methionyl-tRNA formyltransferase